MNHAFSTFITALVRFFKIGALKTFAKFKRNTCVGVFI